MTPDDTVADWIWPGLTFAQVAAELARELASRRSVYPEQIAKGRMTQAEADYQIAVMETVAGEWRDRDHVRARDHSPFTHAERLACIERELAYRQRLYPQWIAKGRLEAERAAHRITALEAVRDLYVHGHGWRASTGIEPGWGSWPRTPEQRAAEAEFRAFARDHPTKFDQLHAARGGGVDADQLPLYGKQ